mgnify:CR=1 FL=1
MMIAEVARNANEAALTATDDTPYDSAYSVRDQLIKDNFAREAPDDMSSDDTLTETLKETTRWINIDTAARSFNAAHRMRPTIPLLQSFASTKILCLVNLNGLALMILLHPQK